VNIFLIGQKEVIIIFLNYKIFSFRGIFKTNATIPYPEFVVSAQNTDLPMLDTKIVNYFQKNFADCRFMTVSVLLLCC